MIWYLYPNIVPEKIEAKNYFMKKHKQLMKILIMRVQVLTLCVMYSYYIIRKLFGNIVTLIIPILISYSCLKQVNI